MKNYYLKVNFFIKDNNKKKVINYELYNNDELIKIFNKDESKNISKLIKNNNIKANKINGNYIINNKNFIKKYIYRNINTNNIKYKIFNKKLIYTSLAGLSIISLLGIKNINNKNTQSTSIENEIEYNNIDDDIIFNNVNEDITTEENIIIDNKELSDVNFYFDSEIINEPDIYQFNYEDRSNMNNVQFVKDNYSIYIDKYSKIYGIDANLLTAMICQENWKNEKNYSNIGGHGVLQLESIWNGLNITAFNREINNYETVTVDVMRATDDVDYDIKVGTMIFSYQYNYFNKKYKDLSDSECLIATLFSYNKGITCIDNALSNSNSFDDFLYIVKNTPFGDNKYIEHVLSYLKDQTKLNINLENTDKEIIIDNINIEDNKTNIL